jgi:hypothetical protein
MHSMLTSKQPGAYSTKTRASCRSPPPNSRSSSPLISRSAKKPMPSPPMARSGRGRSIPRSAVQLVVYTSSCRTLEPRRDWAWISSTGWLSCTCFRTSRRYLAFMLTDRGVGVVHHSQRFYSVYDTGNSQVGFATTRVSIFLSPPLSSDAPKLSSSFSSLTPRRTEPAYLQEITSIQFTW